MGAHPGMPLVEVLPPGLEGREGGGLRDGGGERGHAPGDGADGLDERLQLHQRHQGSGRREAPLRCCSALQLLCSLQNTHMGSHPSLLVQALGLARQANDHRGSFEPTCNRASTRGRVLEAWLLRRLMFASDIDIAWPRLLYRCCSQLAMCSPCCTT